MFLRKAGAGMFPHHCGDTEFGFFPGMLLRGGAISLLVDPDLPSAGTVEKENHGV
jgi:hypothetical protein